jgi:hypothetical protein
MMTHANRALLAAAVCACLVVSSSHAQTPAKPAAKAAPATRAAPATGPWAKVPALTTACYSEADPFNGQLSAAIASVNADIERQKAVNSQIEEQFDSIDPMEKAQRMQQWMMSNPQEAMKYAQAQQAIGQASQEQLGGQLADEQAFNEERQGMPAKYQAALKQAYAPAEARWDALIKKISDAGQCEGAHEGGCRFTDADHVEGDAIDRQRDEAYRATCAQYFGAAGQVPAYLKRYRDWLVTKRTPFDLKGDEARLAQYAIMNTPTASWQSTVAAGHAVEYMQVAESLYGLRDSEPNCTAAGCKRKR